MCWPRGGPEFERKSDYRLLWTLYDKINVQKEVHLNASRPKSDPQIVACADADLGNERDDRGLSPDLYCKWRAALRRIQAINND